MNFGKLPLEIDERVGVSSVVFAQSSISDGATPTQVCTDWHDVPHAVYAAGLLGVCRAPVRSGIDIDADIRFVLLAHH